MRHADNDDWNIRCLCLRADVLRGLNCGCRSRNVGEIEEAESRLREGRKEQAEKDDGPEGVAAAPADAVAEDSLNDKHDDGEQACLPGGSKAA